MSTLPRIRRLALLVSALLTLAVIGPAVASPVASARTTPADTARHVTSSPDGTSPYVSSFSRSLTKGGPSFTGGTIRMPVDPTLSGSAASLTLSNQFGASALEIGSVTLASQSSGGTAAVTPIPVTFDGKRQVSIPAGEVLTSDALQVTITAGHTLLVSIYMPGPTPTIALHNYALESTYFATGDATGAISSDAFTAGTTLQAYVLSRLNVGAPGATALVALGDSITDAGGTPGKQERWTQLLAQRLRESGVTNVSVPNAGLVSNRVTVASDGYDGDSAVNRFEADVLTQPGIGSVFIFEGINDVSQSISAEALIAGYRNLMTRARERGLKVNMATIGPWRGWGTYTEEREATRQALNTWIRTESGADYVADFDAALRNPADPASLLSSYDTGDHLHPNTAGMQAMANAVDLSRLAY